MWTHEVSIFYIWLMEGGVENVGEWGGGGGKYEGDRDLVKGGGHFSSADHCNLDPFFCLSPKAGFL